MRHSASALHHHRHAAAVCWEHARSLLSLCSILQWSNCMYGPTNFQFGCQFIKELIWQTASKSTNLMLLLFCFRSFIWKRGKIMSCNLWSRLHGSKHEKTKPFFLYLKNSCCRYIRFTCEEFIIICTRMTLFSAFNAQKSLPLWKMDGDHDFWSASCWMAYIWCWS